MANITAAWTTEGLNKAIYAKTTNAAAQDAVWFINPTYFAVSSDTVSTGVTALADRTISDLSPIFTRQRVSARNIVDTNTIQAICTVPVKANAVSTFIKEIYLFSEDTSTVEELTNFDFLSDISSWTLTGPITPTYHSSVTDPSSVKIPYGASISQSITNLIATRTYALDLASIKFTGDPTLQVQVTVYDDVTGSVVLEQFTITSSALFNQSVFFTPTGTDCLVTVECISVSVLDGNADYVLIDHVSCRNQWLMMVGQPAAAIPYDPDGVVTMNLNLTITNTDVADIINITNTHAIEIADHNKSFTSHPELVSTLKRSGIFVDYAAHQYQGQGYDEKASLEASVVSGDVVYLGSDNVYYKASMSSEATSQWSGIVIKGDVQTDVPRDTVYWSGLVTIAGHGITVGNPAYLSFDTPGTVSSVNSGVSVGIAVDANTLFLGGSSSNASSSHINNVSFEAGVVNGDIVKPLVSGTYDIASDIESVDSYVGIADVTSSRIQVSGLFTYTETGITFPAGTLIYLGASGAITSTVGKQLVVVSIKSVDANTSEILLSPSITAPETQRIDLSVAGNTTLGDVGTDSLTVNAKVASSVLTDSIGAYDFGDAVNYWKSAHVLDLFSYGNSHFSGNLTVEGNFTLLGTSTTVNREVTTTDNLIILNNGEAGAGITTVQSGLQVDRGSLVDYRFVFEEGSQSFVIGEYWERISVTNAASYTVGELVEVGTSGTLAFKQGKILAIGAGTLDVLPRVGFFNVSDSITGATSTTVGTVTAVDTIVGNSLQPVATREYNPSANAIPYWDSATSQYSTNSNILLDTTNTRVGLGLAAPSVTLDVLGDSLFTGTTTLDSGDTAPAIGSGALKVGHTTVAGGRLEVAGQLSGLTWVQGSNGTVKMPLLLNPLGGGLGIGIITTPTEALEVGGNIKLTGAGSGVVFDDASQLSSYTDIQNEIVAQAMINAIIFS